MASLLVLFRFSGSFLAIATYLPLFNAGPLSYLSPMGLSCRASKLLVTGPFLSL